MVSMSPHNVWAVSGVFREGRQEILLSWTGVLSLLGIRWQMLEFAANVRAL